MKNSINKTNEQAKETKIDRFIKVDEELTKK